MLFLKAQNFSATCSFVLEAAAGDVVAASTEWMFSFQAHSNGAKERCTSMTV